MILPAFAAECRAAAPGCDAACCCRAPGAVGRYLLRVQHSAANPPHAAAAFDWWDRLTDGQTDTGPFYRPCSAYYAHSVKKRVQLSNCQCSASLNFLRKILSTLDPIDGPYSNFTLFSRVTVRAGSVSVFSKVGIGFGFSKYRDIGFSARTYRCLSNDTIADILRPPLCPEWGLGPRITNCGHKR